MRLDLPSRIEVEVYAIHKLSHYLEEIRLNKVLMIVSKSALHNNYLEAKFTEMFKNFKTYHIIFTDYQGEPTSNHLSHTTEIARTHNVDGIIGIGGGSAMDLAKATSFQEKNPSYSIQDVPQLDKIDRLPLITVPTTAGTGSDVNKIKM
ncbi:iron-containing alcohol dehydrogenase [Halalkalibacillus halophilus]|uniref:iron-containing alcohol dehydrogenase n=1 Tax=Halalkalibacillus halophilus TaxID=392827 RepID=UPI00040ABD20|nr:iron-containing alcohol dehydrogenase [Halalkalibacillus halophilus]